VPSRSITFVSYNVRPENLRIVSRDELRRNVDWLRRARHREFGHGGKPDEPGLRHIPETERFQWNANDEPVSGAPSLGRKSAPSGVEANRIPPSADRTGEPRA
jgi:hypothetical protein